MLLAMPHLVKGCTSLAPSRGAPGRVQDED